jgi:hypothetical protein
MAPILCKCRILQESLLDASLERLWNEQKLLAVDWFYSGLGHTEWRVSRRCNRRGGYSVPTLDLNIRQTKPNYRSGTE